MASGFRVERQTFIPAKEVYDRLADANAWSQWTSMVYRSELVQLGTIDPLGAGAIRRMTSLRGLMTVDEEILVATSPHYQRYTLRGLPARGYIGEVHINENDGRTRILWTAEFRPRLAGTGFVLGKFLGFAIGRITDSLIAACERAATNDL